MYTYNQQIKKQSREQLVSHAIQALTTGRQNSFLVTKDHMHRIIDHFNSLFTQFVGNKNFNLNFLNKHNWLLFGEKNSWFNFYDGICKPKTSGELKVLYLSGPEPYNDIEVLCDAGIRLENIWAIESQKDVYEQALQSLVEANIYIKIHRGSLTEFFEMTNHEFDIVYFDACSPIISSNQSPLETLKQIFVNKRLTPLSVLITNFSEPGDGHDWGKILATWFASKDSVEVPSEDGELGMSPLEKSNSLESYSKYINQHLTSYYDAFLTHFIPALGSEIIPMWQFASISSIQSNHLLNESALQNELKAIKDHEAIAESMSDFVINVQHYLLAVDAYPLLNWARLIKESTSKDQPLNRFIASNRKKITIEDALYIGTLLKRFEEGDTGFKTFIYNICGPKLKETLANLDFFDRHLRLTCDIPMKNLLVELLIGLYGHPYIAHAGKTLSLKYKAKEKWMYSNAFVFDQCRYLYDFMPTLDLWTNFFNSIPNQMVIRSCIDGIYRNHFALNRMLFQWGFIEDMYGEFGCAELSERINLNESH